MKWIKIISYLALVLFIITNTKFLNEGCVNLILPCAVQNFKWISRLKFVLKTNDISERYTILPRPLGLPITVTLYWVRWRFKSLASLLFVIFTLSLVRDKTICTYEQPLKIYYWTDVPSVTIELSVTLVTPLSTRTRYPTILIFYPWLISKVSITVENNLSP